MVGDSLMRTLFYLAIITCNDDMVVAFEEPEAHIHPYFVKELAERIARDDRGNQYFISTYSPLFLLTLLEKAPKNDVNVFVTHYENHETKVRPLSEEQVEKIFEYGDDVFFNLGTISEET